MLLVTYPNESLYWAETLATWRGWGKQL